MIIEMTTVPRSDLPLDRQTVLWGSAAYNRKYSHHANKDTYFIYNFLGKKKSLKSIRNEIELYSLS